MSIFLGIDGGGSQTSCAVGDETSLLGSGSGAGSNVVRVGEAQARKSIAAAVYQACAAAKVTPQQIKRTCVGVAGGARPETTEVIRRILSELVSGEIEVVGDMVIAMEAASGTGPGVIVIAGTGSIAYGRNAGGQTARAGGWGFAISDEGSGHWIGRAAVTAAMRAFDEGQNGGLLESIMKAWGASTREQMILVSNSSPPPDFAGLFPAVLTAVDAGDARAHDILARAGVELATLAKIVIARLFADVDRAPVAMSGGVFRNSALIRQVFYNRLRLECPKAVVNVNVVDPVQGALELARRAALGAKA
ncbi:MAG: BadF/BadG/BcrA/BcrD ATPase family protein [Terriglobales bacterium]|jgi:N-acetylglucosamine kinase-like BadF-type ATPase